MSEQCKTANDPYFLALVGMSHFNPQTRALPGIEIVRTLTRFQGEDGHIAGAKTSVAGSHGRDLAVETTALTILAWLQADRPGEFNTDVQKAIKWLGQQRRGQGGYGGTQPTILALKAMLAYARKNPQPLQAGDVQISLDRGSGFGVPLNFAGPPTADNFADAERVSFSPRAQEPITVTLRDVNILKPGKNVVSLNVTGGNTLPYTLTWSYRLLQPANDPQAPVKLTTSLGAEKVTEGETVKLHAEIANVSGQGQGMAIAVIGLPAGLSLPENGRQLDMLAHWQGDKPGKIAAWELRGRELVLYWRALPAGAKIAVDLDLLCRYPGLYRGPPSRAYLYHDGDRKFWTSELNIRIAEAK